MHLAERGPDSTSTLTVYDIYPFVHIYFTPAQDLRDYRVLGAMRTEDIVSYVMSSYCRYLL